MAEPNSSDDPTVIAASYAKVAKETVSETAKVATDAYDRINADRTKPNPPPPYGSRDAINSMAQLANVALTGGISLARITLGLRPARGAQLVADNVASIVNRGLSDAIDVMSDVAAEGNAGMNSTPPAVNSDSLVDAAIKLTKIGMLRGAEIVETLVAGPGAYGDPILRRTLSIVPTDYPRVLDVSALTLAGSANDKRHLVTFDPPDGQLAANEGAITVVIDTAGLESGVYTLSLRGRAVPDPANAGAALPGDTTDNVLVALPGTNDPPEP